jgi:hypothetical protein
MSEVDPNLLREDFTLLARPVELPPPAIPDGAQWHPPVLIGIGAVLLLIWFGMRWRRYRRQPPRGERPDVIAMRELAQWRDLKDEGQYRQAVVVISAISRRYVEGRFGVRAPTLTTEEFWVAQRKEAKIPGQYMPFFERFLDSIDGIKYAGCQPSAPQYEELVASTVRFVESSRKGRSRS